MKPEKPGYLQTVVTPGVNHLQGSRGTVIQLLQGGSELEAYWTFITALSCIPNIKLNPCRMTSLGTVGVSIRLERGDSNSQLL